MTKSHQPGDLITIKVSLYSPRQIVLVTEALPTGDFMGRLFLSGRRRFLNPRLIQAHQVMGLATDCDCLTKARAAKKRLNVTL